MGEMPGHLLLLPRGRSYELVEGNGAAPEEGTAVELDGRYLVTKVGPSPLPGDPRRCAYLIPAG